MYLPDGDFGTNFVLTTNWRHIVMNYLGPVSGEGLRIYVDGDLSSMHAAALKDGGSYSPGDGNVVLGRYYEDFYDDSDPYTGAYIDELLFFNTTLYDGHIVALANNLNHKYGV